MALPNFETALCVRENCSKAPRRTGTPKKRGMGWGGGLGRNALAAALYFTWRTDTSDQRFSYIYVCAICVQAVAGQPLLNTWRPPADLSTERRALRSLNLARRLSLLRIGRKRFPEAIELTYGGGRDKQSLFHSATSILSWSSCQLFHACCSSANRCAFISRV